MRVMESRKENIQQGWTPLISHIVKVMNLEEEAIGKDKISVFNFHY